MGSIKIKNPIRPSHPSSRNRTRRLPNYSYDIESKGLRLSLARRTHIMGVLNVTPDSFSDGGLYLNPDKALERALLMAGQGADIIDVGGESTRPGAPEVGTEEEMRRVIPIIKAITRATDVPVSIDTRKSDVADAALSAGARIINDVSGFKHDKRMASVAAKRGVAVVIMHMRGSPADMQSNTVYKDVVSDVVADIGSSIESALRAGVKESSIIIDPGIGFAKTAAQSLEILGRLDELKVLKRPICVGVSRKSFIGHVLGGAGTDQRAAGTIAACAVAIIMGASILRVHDVREAKEAALVADSIARKIRRIRAN